ncbi:MAG: VacJ family lipoprotein [Alphaproteobacteria bacterium]
MKKAELLRRSALVLVLCLGVAGCSNYPTGNGESKIVADSTYDPLERVNRVTFDVNDFLDRLLFKPLAELYRFFTPTYLRDRVSGIFSDMNEPVVFGNSLMQGRLNDAGVSLGRLVVNSTVGVGGMWDIAGKYLGWPAKTADFGQTLHSWGLGQGPYIVLPLFGSSTLRDGIGMGVDTVMSPWGYISKLGPHSTSSAYTYTSTGVGALVKREQHIDDLEKLRAGSIDFYAQMRSVYLQYRNKQLGISVPTPALDSYDEK